MAKKAASRKKPDSKEQLFNESTNHRAQDRNRLSGARVDSLLGTGNLHWSQSRRQGPYHGGRWWHLVHVFRANPCSQTCCKSILPDSNRALKCILILGFCLQAFRWIQIKTIRSDWNAVAIVSHLQKFELRSPDWCDIQCHSIDIKLNDDLRLKCTYIEIYDDFCVWSK
jgi:hypothetical protein